MRQGISVLFSLLIISMILGGCMRSIRIEPDGFAELIEGFEILEISIRSVYYSPPPHNMAFRLYLHCDGADRNHIIRLRDTIAEYLRSEQFIEFVEGHEADIDYESLGVIVHILNPGGEGIAMFETFSNHENFTKWSGP